MTVERSPERYAAQYVPNLVSQMSTIRFHALPDLQRPLLDKFYRAQRSSMRSKGEAQFWVARTGEVVGGLCLTPMAEGHWLTGLFVAPSMRGRGVGAGLVKAAVAHVQGCVWLFCEPDLVAGFYRRLGFVETEDLPRTLADRLARYRQTRTLVALVFPDVAILRSVGADHQTKCAIPR
mgnify:CR=1 FL=1